VNVRYELAIFGAFVAFFVILAGGRLLEGTAVFPLADAACTTALFGEAGCP